MSKTQLAQVRAAIGERMERIRGHLQNFDEARQDLRDRLDSLARVVEKAQSAGVDFRIMV